MLYIDAMVNRMKEESAFEGLEAPLWPRHDKATKDDFLRNKMKPLWKVFVEKKVSLIKFMQCIPDSDANDV